MQTKLERAIADHDALTREPQRQRESAILEAAAQLDASDDSLQARHLRAVAEQIRDHRECGNYTTMHH